jgi:hypothetical protein
VCVAHFEGHGIARSASNLKADVNGLLASGTRADNIAQARRLLDVRATQTGDANGAEANEPKPLSHPCLCCGGRMIIIERFRRGSSPRYRPATSIAVIRIDTS